MQQAIKRQIKQVKAAIMAGRPQQAHDDLERLLALMRRDPPPALALPALESALAELRILAEAALSGAHSAADQLQAIIREARSLDTYDHRGQRKTADTATAQPRRF